MCSKSLVDSRGNKYLFPLDLHTRRKMKDQEEEIWFIEKTIQQAQYMNMVNKAAIPGQAKDFCRYIASKCTWDHKRPGVKKYQPCFATQDTIEIQMGRSTDYVTKAKKLAIYYGWVQVKHRSHTSDQIWPSIGLEDEKIAEKNERVKRDSSEWVKSELFPDGHPGMQS